MNNCWVWKKGNLHLCPAIATGDVFFLPECYLKSMLEGFVWSYDEEPNMNMALQSLDQEEESQSPW